ncbi:flavodoxin domain-containing protein [Demequina phytophila]|uniref:flavodoxin domain-containing protein n=1 Tax=Demequina phytophila TaxID=1638981 RepID=UPI0007811332|nr:flavodoxin domain-containing protein [Demequina phytophila]
MDIVVFESLYGNTAAVAAAIAAGLSADARALTTSEATRELIEEARIVVAGAPVHAMSLPTAATRESARAKPQGADHMLADLGHLSMRDWLTALPRGPRLGAAFDTRVRGPLGHGSSRAIAQTLEACGFTLLDAPRGFTVHMHTSSSAPGALLARGQLDLAREWGEHLQERAASLV